MNYSRYISLIALYNTIKHSNQLNMARATFLSNYKFIKYFFSQLSVECINKAISKRSEHTLLMSVMILLFAGSLKSQLASFDFENSLLDNSSGFEAIYLESEVPALNPNYVTGPTGLRLYLDPFQGIKMPLSINPLLDTAKSIQIEMDFRVTDFELDSHARKFLLQIGTRANVNELGFFIYTHHDVFDPDPNVEIYFGYADGKFASIPDHIGHDKLLIGTVMQGEEVNLRIYFDFEKNSWMSIVNGVITQNKFNNIDLDFDLIKTVIRDYPVFFGIGNELADQVAYRPEFYSASIQLDNVSIHSPREPGDISLFKTALLELKDHCNGSTLDESTLRTHMNTIFINYHGNYDQAQAEIFDFINAYESNYPPVFTNRIPIATKELLPESQVLIFLQQNIFDDQYSSSNVSNMVGVAYEFSEIYPGPVASNAPRVSDAQVTVDANFNILPGARLSSDLSDTKRPTGYYAAPGELVTITIPASIVNKGFTAMIGAHDRDHSNLSATNRFVRMSKDFALNQITTQIISPFGGGVYIKFPEGTQEGDVAIKIDGAVKSPYLSTRSSYPSSPTEWEADLGMAYVQWVDMESDKFMMTLPLDHVKNIDYSQHPLIMDRTDEMMDAYRYIGGRPYDRNRSQYFLIDSRLPNNAFGTGYPQVIGEYSAPFAPYDLKYYYPTILIEPDFYKSSFTTTLHEYGHLAKHPTLNNEVESIVNLIAVYFFNEYHNVDLDTAFKYSLHEEFTLEGANMDWMVSSNFRNNLPMSCDPSMADHNCDELRYQHRSWAKYVEMADLFGWQSVHNMNKAIYEVWKLEANYDYYTPSDDIIRAACEANCTNLMPLLHFWGLQPSSQLKAELDYLPKSNLILNRLDEYKTLIPQNQIDFSPWYNELIEKKDPVHHARLHDSYDNYDIQNYADQMEAQIDLIKSIYYPTGSAEDDYFVWCGSTDSDWANGQNWGGGIAPDATSDVVIPGGKPNYPIVNEHVQIQKIEIQDGACIEVLSGFSFDVLCSN